MSFKYEIAPVDLLNEGLRQELSDLLTMTFGKPLFAEDLVKTVFTKSFPQRTLYLGAFEKAKLIGFSAFMSHDFILGGQVLLAHQVCWSAVSPHHHGKRIFFNIVEYAKTFLQGMSTAFLFAYSMSARHIFLGPLKFVEVGRHAILNVPRLGQRFFINGKAPVILVEDSICQNEWQLIERKRELHGEGGVFVCSRFENTIWGRLSSRRLLGIQVPYFIVGGVILNNSALFPQTVKVLFRESGASFLQFVCHDSSDFLNLFRGFRRFSSQEPLSVFNLKLSTPLPSFNFMLGVRDVF